MKKPFLLKILTKSQPKLLNDQLLIKTKCTRQKQTWRNSFFDADEYATNQKSEAGLILCF